MKAALGAVAVALTGCASSSPHAAPLATSAISTPTSTPTPSPTTLTIAQARAIYLRMVKPFNDDIKAANKIMTSSSPSLTALHRIARKGRLDTHRWAINLRTLPWPADCVPVAQRYADSLAAEVLDWGALSTDTGGEANTDWNSLADDTVKSAKIAEQMRERLGLPPAR